ncbi:MAG: ABC transporter substrate-binding protein [Dehalococcoidia bacterium]
MGEFNSTVWTRARVGRRQLIRSTGIGAVGLGAAALIGCGSSSSGGGDAGGSGGASTPATSQGAPSATSAPSVRKKGGVIKTSMVADPPGWSLFQASSATVQLGSHAYDKLTDVATGPGKSGYSVELIPQIATAMPETPDENTYVYKIRQGVKFQNVAPVNGRAMTAEDVKQSIDTLRGNKQWAADFGSVKEVTTPDANTVIVKTSRPDATLMNLSSGHYGWRIHPKEMVDSKDHEKNAIGTGPFIRSEQIQGTKTTFKRNPDYWNKDLPLIDGIEFLVISDPVGMAGAFRTKQIDILTVSVGAAQTQDLRKQVSSFANEQQEFGNSPWIALDTSKPPFNDLRVRQAVAMLYNRQAEVEAVHLGEADPVGTALLPYPDALKPADLPDMAKLAKLNIAEAKKLLEAAGHGSGFKTPIHVTPQYFRNSGYEDSFQRFVGDLKQAGIEGTVQTHEYGVWIKEIYRPPYKFDGILWGPGRYYADPDPYVKYWLHPKGIANQSRVNDPEMTALVEKQATQINQKERWATLQEIQKLEAKNTYYIWRVTPKNSVFVDKKIKDFSRHEGYDSREFWHAWIDA